MSDYVTKYLGVGIVVTAWAVVGVFASPYWPPAKYLTIPAVLWFATFIFGIGVGVPVVRGYYWVRGWRRV